MVEEQTKAEPPAPEALRGGADDETAKVLDDLNLTLTAAARRVRSPRVFAMLGKASRVFIQPHLIMLFAKISETGPVRTTDLAPLMALDRSTVSRQVQELVDAGLVVRQPDLVDKRSYLVAPSPAGIAAQTSVVQAWRDVLYETTQDWPAEDRRTFAELLRRFDQSLERVVDDARERELQAQREAMHRRGVGDAS